MLKKKHGILKQSCNNLNHLICFILIDDCLRYININNNTYLIQLFLLVYNIEKYSFLTYKKVRYKPNLSCTEIILVKICLCHFSL